MELDELYSELDDTPSSVAKAEALKDAIRLADQQNNLEYSRKFRIMLLDNEQISTYDQLIAISWVLSDLDKRNAPADRSLLIDYQDIMADIAFCTEVSKDSIYAMLTDFRKRLNAIGYGDMDYYESLLLTAIAMDDRAIADSAYESYIKPDKRKALMSSPEAWAATCKMQYWRYVGDFEAMVQELKIPKQKDSRLDRAHSFLIAAAVELGRLDDIADVMPIFCDIIFGFAGYRMIFMSYMDKDLGLTRYKNGLKNSIRYPAESLHFELGAAVLMEALGDSSFSAKLPKEFSLYKADGQYSATELAAYHYNRAKTISDNMDRRNGTDRYNKQLQYIMDKGIPQESKKFEWYTKAAKNGEAIAQNALGYLYSYGNRQGIPKDYSLAFEWFSLAAAQGNNAAQTNLGLMYDRGDFVTQDYGKAVEWYLKAAENGSEVAENNLGGNYFDGKGVAQDYSKAMEWYAKAIEHGNSLAQSNIGFMYEKGKGMPQDYAKAIECYTKAIEQGCKHAKSNLGELYEKGKGIAQDYAKAFELYSEAAEQENRNGQYNLGRMYDEGKGIPQDYTKAFEWYFRSAEWGYAAAQYSLGKLYDEGRGIAQDHDKAMELYKKAFEKYTKDAELENPDDDVQYSLGEMYDEGRGVAQDHDKAMELYKKAAAQGNEDAQRKLDEKR